MEEGRKVNDQDKTPPPNPAPTPPPPKLPPVTPQLAAQILDLDFANILKKVRAGRPLTASERALVAVRQGKAPIEAVDEAAEPVTSKAALARALGVSRQLVQAWSQEPDFPKPAENGVHSVEAVREWCRIHKRGPQEEEAGPGPGLDGLPSVVESERRYEAAKAAIEEMKRDRMRGELVEVSAVEAMWDVVVATAKRHLSAMPSKVESQFVPGMTAADVRAMVEREADEVMEELAKPMNYTGEAELAAAEEDDENPEEEAET